MSTKRVLTMTFNTDTGKAANIRLPHCKTDLTEATVRGAMDTLITGQIFSATLTTKKGAKIVEQTETKLF